MSRLRNSTAHGRINSRCSVKHGHEKPSSRQRRPRIGGKCSPAKSLQLLPRILGQNPEAAMSSRKLDAVENNIFARCQLRDEP